MTRTLIILLLSIATTRAVAQESGFGLGIMLGEPTGISGKVWTGGTNAFAFGLAWGGWGRGGYFHAHGDYLFHNNSLFNVNTGDLALHYGPGVRMRTWGGDRYWANGRYYDSRGGHTRLGIRFPVGLTYMFAGAPFDIFLEVAPTLDVLPGTTFDMSGGLGARYYFR
jgi:hypothetical protein